MRYKAYKKVDIPWLDEVPSHWEISRNKNIFKHVKNIIGEKSQSTQLLSLTTMGIKAINNEDTKGKSPVSYDTYQIVSKDDLVLCLFDLDVSAVFSDVSKYNGMISPAYQVFKTDKVYINFYKYIFDKIFQDRSYKVHSKSLRYTITPEGFLMLNMIIPPKEEQEQIAKFLDWKINEIDRLIGIREEKVRKINKIKISFIENAISGKIGNKFINFKKVDIPWLDEVPSHWKITRLKNIIQVSFSGLWGEEFAEELLPISCIRVADFKFEDMQLNKNIETIRYYTKEQIKEKKLINGDLLLEKSGGGEKTPVGRLVYNDFDNCMCANFIQVIRLKNSFESKYIAYLLKNYYHKGNVNLFIKQTTGIQNLDIKEYLNQLIIFPPKEKQEQIVKKIEEQNYKINRLVKNIKFQINNLKLLKQSLISDAVTGKIDVRNIKIPNFSKFENRYLEEDEDYLEDTKEV